MTTAKTLYDFLQLKDKTGEEYLIEKPEHTWGLF